MVKLEKEIPWCTVICVTLALISHTCVLIGNLETSSALKSIGTSTGGWSKVGVGIGRAFKEELDVEMTKVTSHITDALGHIAEVTENLDSLVALIGGTADNATADAKASFLQSTAFIARRTDDEEYEEVIASTTSEPISPSDAAVTTSLYIYNNDDLKNASRNITFNVTYTTTPHPAMSPDQKAKLKKALEAKNDTDLTPDDKAKIKELTNGTNKSTVKTPDERVAETPPDEKVPTPQQKAAIINGSANDTAKSPEEEVLVHPNVSKTETPDQKVSARMKANGSENATLENATVKTPDEKVADKVNASKALTPDEKVADKKNASKAPTPDEKAAAKKNASISGNKTVQTPDDKVAVKKSANVTTPDQKAEAKKANATKKVTVQTPDDKKKAKMNASEEILTPDQKAEAKSKESGPPMTPDEKILEKATAPQTMTPDQKIAKQKIAKQNASIETPKKNASIVTPDEKNKSKAKEPKKVVTKHIPTPDEKQAAKEAKGPAKPIPLNASKLEGDMETAMKDFVKQFVNEKVKSAMDSKITFIQDKLEIFLQKVNPVLTKVSEWLVKFGDKILSALEGFSGTIDQVQKIFDKLMSALSSGKPEGITEKMVHDTYTLMDMDNIGFVTKENLEMVGKMYGIDALQGTKPELLMKTYDTDNNSVLDQREYTLAMQDPGIPGAMDVVLRAYTKKLSEVAARVGRAKMRDELSKAVVNYLQLVCAKNTTKMQWVSTMLTNRTLPVEFTADVLIQLGLAADDSNVLTTANVGQLVVREMVRLGKDGAFDAFETMTNQSFFMEEGFDPDDYAAVIRRVTLWFVQARGHLEESPRFFAEDEQDLAQISDDIVAELPSMAHEQAQMQIAGHVRQRRKAKQRHQASFSSSAKFVLHHLSGGRTAKDAPVTVTAAEKAIKSGVPAKPVTLEFAKWLSWNATRTAATFQKQCFDDSSSSSSPLDSFGSDIAGLTKKLTGFLKMMETWTQPGYISYLVGNFSSIVEKDILKIVDKLIDQKLGIVMKPVLKVLNDTIVNDTKGYYKSPVSLAEGSASLEQVVRAKEEAELSTRRLGSRSKFGCTQFNEDELRMIEEDAEFGTTLSGMWDKIVTVLHSLNNMLPQAATVLKEARVTVSGAAEQMDSVFSTFETKGPTIFESISELWSTLWILYFCFFFPLTATLLFYGFWASGWFGGPQKPEAMPAELVTAAEAGSWQAKLRVCCRSCSTCLSTFHDTALCFWSVIILMEVVCLLIFVVSILLNIFAGVKSMIVAGCTQVYMLNDPQICLQTLNLFKGFLTTFHIHFDGEDLNNACIEHSLLTCDAVIAKMKSSMTLTTVFSFLAAIMSFQMIIESSILHERARWRRILDSMETLDDDSGEEK